MALQLTWVDPLTQVQAPLAYARIVSINVDCNAQTIDLGVGLYATAGARTAGYPPFALFHAWPPYEQLLGQTIDVRAAAYWFLRSLPEFSASNDV